MTLRNLVEALCSEACSGRAPGTPGGRAARAVVEGAFRDAGLKPEPRAAPGCGGTNILATVPGTTDRWVLVAAHYDHLGRQGKDVYWGADDNAAGVAILVQGAGALAARPPQGRGVIFAAFDGEEPPYYLTEAMGSDDFVRRPTVPLDRIDLMVCMDLVGHALGPVGMPEEIRRTVFALGAERSEGTAAHVDRLARAVDGVVIRRADAETIPPLSDYWAFWRREVPFLFLSCGRWRHYHTPEDTPEKLDYAKMAALASWLERFVRETCARPEPRVRYLRHARDDASTLRSMADLAAALAPVLPPAAQGERRARELLAACGPDGRLPDRLRPELEAMVENLESGLS